MGHSGVASEFQAGLIRAGYADVRWFPIGSHYQHGFVVTTRLERLDGPPVLPSARWLSVYPEPMNLRWLTFARTPTLPEPGQYRAFLIAFTDLPLSSSTAAPIWNEQTVMDGPGSRERRTPPPEMTKGPASADYRVGIYEYSYDWDVDGQRGRFRSTAGAPPVPGWPSSLHGLLPIGDAAHE